MIGMFQGCWKSIGKLDDTIVTIGQVDGSQYDRVKFTPDVLGSGNNGKKQNVQKFIFRREKEKCVCVCCLFMCFLGCFLDFFSGCFLPFQEKEFLFHGFDRISSV